VSASLAEMFAVLQAPAVSTNAVQDMTSTTTSTTSTNVPNQWSPSNLPNADADAKALRKRIALLEKMISVCIPDDALVRKLESAAVWNEAKQEYSIPVHYVSSNSSNSNAAR
jgi:hypothetical protein